MSNLDLTKHPEVKGCSTARIAKWYEHAKCGAHAVATLSDVEALMAEIKSLRDELEEDIGVIKVWRRRLAEAEVANEILQSHRDQFRNEVEWWRAERLRLLRLLHNSSIQLGDGSVIDSDGLGWPDPPDTSVTPTQTDDTVASCAVGHAYELRQATGKQTCIRCFQEMPWPESNADDAPELQEFYSNFAFRILADSFLCTAASRIFNRLSQAIADSKLDTYTFVKK